MNWLGSLQAQDMAYQAFSRLILLLSVIVLSAEAGSIGVDYGRDADNLPTPDKVVELLKSQGITKVKIYDTDATVLRALANSGISVVVALPNKLVASTAADQSTSDKWVRDNISPFYPATKIETIAVGNEVFKQSSANTNNLVPAMKNVHASLVKFNLDSNIKISSPISFDSLQISFPPSAGKFKPELISVIKPMLDFLEQTGSYLTVNIYPYFTYSNNPDKISLDYALFKDNPGVVDTNNGLKYHNLFDAQLDAVYSAMSSVGQNPVKTMTMRSLKKSNRRIPIQVTESGWPSKGTRPTERKLNEIGASEANAATYNGNLVRRVFSGSGTPLRPQDPITVYIFALFNENRKQGPTSERNFGLFYPDMRKVYDIPLTPQQVNNGGQTWCVANVNSDRKKLQDALDYACGEGGADCGPIQPGGQCYNPNTLEAHASYAFNSYYQKKARQPGTCHFGGVALVTSQRPKYGNCEFPTN